VIDDVDAAEMAGLERDLLRYHLSRCFADFFRDGWAVLEPSTPLLWSWPYEEVCAHLQATIEDWAERQHRPSFVQRVRSLLCTLPPGCLKSRLLSYLIPWAWLRWPELRAIALSCNPRVALRDSMYSRDVIASDWYQRTFAPSWKVRQDSDAKGMYSNTAGGFRSAMGFDARIVGERGDLIIVDDPHDPEEAESDVQREAVNERWDSSIGNRVNDLGSSIRIGIAQRTHEDDWSSRRIAEGWTHLDFPMLYEPDRACVTPLGSPDRRTIVDECLHPERFPPEVIAAERLRVGERRWATLYQGRPSKAGGSLVKLADLRFHRAPGRPDAASSRPSGCWKGPSVETPSSMDSICIAGDLAMGRATKDGDYNVIGAIGRKGSSFFVLEMWRARADFPAVQAKYRELSARYPLARKVVERAAAGASLEASLRAEIPGLISVPPQGSKLQRLHAVLSFFDAGNVHFDEYMPGLDVAITELVTFPARHDDVVDFLSLGLSQCALRRGDYDGATPETMLLLGGMLGGANGDAGNFDGSIGIGGSGGSGGDLVNSFGFYAVDLSKIGGGY